MEYAVIYLKTEIAMSVTILLFNRCSLIVVIYEFFVKKTNGKLSKIT